MSVGFVVRGRVTGNYYGPEWDNIEYDLASAFKFPTHTTALDFIQARAAQKSGVIDVDILRVEVIETLTAKHIL